MVAARGVVLMGLLRASALVLACMFISLSQASAAQKVRLVPPGWPKQLAIPRINVQAPIESVAFNRASDMMAPYHWDDTAWYDRGPRPGELGRATIIGHLDSYCCPAVFWRLSDLQPGDVVQVMYRTRQTLTFKVMWKREYWNYQLPEKWLFASVKERGLVLITCAGVFHRDGTGYDHKLMVYARLLLPSGRLG